MICELHGCAWTAKFRIKKCRVKPAMHARIWFANPIVERQRFLYVCPSGIGQTQVPRSHRLIFDRLTARILRVFSMLIFTISDACPFEAFPCGGKLAAMVLD